MRKAVGAGVACPNDECERHGSHDTAMRSVSREDQVRGMATTNEGSAKPPLWSAYPPDSKRRPFSMAAKKRWYGSASSTASR